MSGYSNFTQYMVHKWDLGKKEEKRKESLKVCTFCWRQAGWLRLLFKQPHKVNCNEYTAHCIILVKPRWAIGLLHMCQRTHILRMKSRETRANKLLQTLNKNAAAIFSSIGYFGRARKDRSEKEMKQWSLRSTKDVVVELRYFGPLKHSRFFAHNIKIMS